MEPAIISAIVAMDENRVIGNQNQLPWHLPADLKHFKTLTLNHPIIMGRKTYTSIGRPLPKRVNIIITRDPAFAAPNCEVVHSFSAALQVAKHEDANEIFVIGGAEIFKIALLHVQRIYLTIVHYQFIGDTFFPDIAMDAWHEISRTRFAADNENPYDYSFITLERN